MLCCLLKKISRKVMVPGAGAMVRMRTLTPEGEEIDVEYRWPRRGDGAWNLQGSAHRASKSLAVTAAVL
jgi:hypothetical protein